MYMQERMIFVRKISFVIFIISFALFASAPVFAQSLNGQSIFMIDSDLAQIGYQGFTTPTGIGPEEFVGFAVYAGNVDRLESFKVDVTWDPALASRDRDSDVLIFEDTITVNGQEITLAEEINILGEDPVSLSQIKEDGHYYGEFGRTGDAIVQEEFVLLYFILLETSASFSTDTSLVVTVKVTIGSGGAEAPRYIGQRYFNVNGISPDVKDSTWGELKNQFKDF